MTNLPNKQILSHNIYLDYALTDEGTLTFIYEEMERIAATINKTGTDRTFHILSHYERARQEVASFLGVSPSNIALINNTTHGLGLVASGLDLSPEDNVLIPEIDFVSSNLVWKRAQEKNRFNIYAVKAANGHLTMEDFAKRADENTKVVVTSSVQEVSGDRLNIEKVASLTQSLDAFLIIDGIQEAGVLTRSLAGSGVDAYVVGGHKWLGSPFGLGFMYVSNRLMEACQPVFDGYFNLVEPRGSWEAYLQDRKRNALDSHAIKQEARKFEPGGMPNFVGALGLLGALRKVKENGLPSIEKHVLSLNRQLRNNLQQLGLGSYILGSSDSDTFSGIVTFGLPGGLQEERELLNKFLNESVIVSLRSIAGIGGIRVSFYEPTLLEDIDYFSEKLEHYMKFK